MTLSKLKHCECQTYPDRKLKLLPNIEHSTVYSNVSNNWSRSKQAIREVHDSHAYPSVLTSTATVIFYTLFCAPFRAFLHWQEFPWVLLVKQAQAIGIISKAENWRKHIMYAQDDSMLYYAVKAMQEARTKMTEACKPKILVCCKMHHRQCKKARNKQLLRCDDLSWKLNFNCF